MVNDYRKIEMFGAETFEWYRGILLKERLLLGKVLELFLESIRPLEEYSKDTDYKNLALLTLATRLFNDAEGASHLLLRGLPAQAQMVIRDIIESSMLLRLFLREDSLSKRWIMGLTEYQPGSVNAILSEMGITAKEYALYGILSHQGHSNLLGSISNIQEDEVEKGVRRTFHFGSSRTQSTLVFIQHSFRVLFYLFHLLLTEPLSEYYSQHSAPDIYSVWAKKVVKLIPELEALTREGIREDGGEMSEVDKHILELVSRRMKLNKSKQRISENMDGNTNLD